MVKLLFYACCVGVPSSRKIEKKTYEDVAFRVLAAGEHPDHDTISEFRHRHLQSLAGLFIQVLQLCRRAGLVKLGHVVLDGTKVKANASRHKAMSYGRLQAKERELERKVKELLEQAELVDAEEDRLYGKGIRGDELAEAKAKAEAKNQEIERKNPTDPLREKKNKGKKRRGRKFKPISAQPKASAQRNFTDPDSRMMLDNSTKAFIYGYNCQAAVDAHNQIIIATATTQAATDKNQLEPMLREIKKNVKIKSAKLSADAGYYSEANIKLLEKAKIDCYIPPDKQGHNQKDTPAPRGRPPDNLSTADRLRRKLKTVRGKKIYAKRKEVVEPVFGQIKGARGLRQFLLRGSEKVSPEWDIWCLTHNVLKLFRSGWTPKFA
jgi:hypothetical protein